MKENLTTEKQTRLNKELIKAIEKETRTIINLIEQGAQVNYQNNWGFTPIIIASKKGLTKVVKELLENGANPNIADITGATAMNSLFRKIGRSSEIELEIAKLLIDKGADLNKLDNDGESPLFGAIVNSDNIKTIQFLIENGGKVGVALEKVISESEFEYISIDTMNILKVAIIFEKDGIKNMSDDLKNYLQREFKFTIDSAEDETKIIKSSIYSYKKFFQSQLALKIKNEMAKGYKATAKLLKIVNDNMQIFKLLFDISPEEMYQDSILDTNGLCKDGNYSMLSLQGTACIYVTELLLKGKLTKETIKATVPTDLFEQLQILEGLQGSTIENEVKIEAAGQTNMEGVD